MGSAAGSAALSQCNLSGIDERNQERWQIINYLRIFNAQTGEMLGHVMNVTTEGIMLISEKPLTVDKEFHLKMAVPLDQEEECETASIELEARSIWNKTDDDPHFHKTGLQFVRCSQDAINALSALIEKLKLLQTSKFNPPEETPDLEE